MITTQKGEQIELNLFVPEKIQHALDNKQSVMLRYDVEDLQRIRFDGERERPEVPLILALPFLSLSWRPRFIFANSRND